MKCQIEFNEELKSTNQLYVGDKVVLLLDKSGTQQSRMK